MGIAPPGSPAPCVTSVIAHVESTTTAVLWAPKPTVSRLPKTPHAAPMGGPLPVMVAISCHGPGTDWRMYTPVLAPMGATHSRRWVWAVPTKYRISPIHTAGPVALGSAL